MQNWKASDLKIRGILTKPKPKTKPNILPKKEPEGIRFIKDHLSLLKIPFETETKFHSKRKFRFDISFRIESLKIAVEYEGIMSKKARHTSVTGFTTDCTKYNLAQMDGWCVLRYTTINYKDFTSDLDYILQNVRI